MATRLTRTEQRDQTRARLLAAAEQVFTARGFHAASVDEVAEEAGYSKGAVYSNFATKDDLFLALLEQRIDSNALAIEGEVSLGADLADQVSQAGASFVDVFMGQSPWSLLLMEYAAHAARYPELRERFAARNRRMRAAMSELIDRHLEALGLEAPVPTDQLATILFSFGNGYIMERLIDPDGVPDELFTSGLLLVLAAMKPRQKS